MAIVFAFSVCPVSGQEIAKATAITIEYWHAFKGVSTHVIEIRKDGTYTIQTKSSDSGRKLEAWKSGQRSLTAKNLEPLIALCNTPEVRRVFAETKREATLDGDALMVRINQNKYSLQFETQPCLKESNSAPDRKLVAIVTELLSKAGLELYEAPNWQDVLVSQEEIDAIGTERLLTALRKLHDREGRLIPLKLYFIGELDEEKQIKMTGESRTVKEILHDIGDALGLTFRTYRDIAVFGTPEELRRFDTAMAIQPPRRADAPNVFIPVMVITGARLDEMTNFMNRKLDEQNSNRRLNALSHADHPVFCTGNEFPVEDIIAVIAADLGEPVAKVFAEKNNP